ncbi:hypothetical protein PPYR_09260 [Photinus pyralis]|uniref:Calcineurin-like phosphoesterase domain-containing protein n=1 Tax=Photinus pyralis TaxID=7054 RepID=A0A5N4ALS0_PHOPY|nr:metallophosphoesterase 1 [Photinus pyralis]KAB0798267.1 hypothetical protein PPYR_09260 [Photinus pyralis]
MKVKLLAQFIILLLCLVVSCEWFVYYVVQLQCDWPTINSTLSVQHNNEKALRTMVFADTHLLGSRRGHWFDKLRREWQMYRAFQTALTLHRPDVVFLLGDITDEGDYCSDDEFRYYVKRFDSLFATPFDVKIFVVAGNHDMGFHYRITPYLNKRFISGFNASAVQFVTLGGNHFVLINSMALERDGCFLCKSAELQLAQIEKKLNCLKSEGNCQRDNLTYSRPILMQHFPLYRETDEVCNEPDEAPFPLKSKKYREGWDCLTTGSTYQLLKQIDPRVVISGHTHYGCTRNLSNGRGVEFTLASFSWRNTNTPSYGLFVFEANNYAFSKCLMPRETTVIMCYILGSVSLLIWLVYAIYCSYRKRKFKYQ